MKKHIVATLFVWIILAGSDLFIGGTGHYVGSGADNILEYLSMSETWIQLGYVFVLALIIVTILRFGLKFLGMPTW